MLADSSKRRSAARGQTPARHTLTALCQGMERKQKEGEETCGRGKDGLIGEAKAVRARKAKEGIHSLLATGGQMSSPFLESWASARPTVA